MEPPAILIFDTAAFVVATAGPDPVAVEPPPVSEPEPVATNVEVAVVGPRSPDDPVAVLVAVNVADESPVTDDELVYTPELREEKLVLVEVVAFVIILVDKDEVDVLETVEVDVTSPPVTVGKIVVEAPLTIQTALPRPACSTQTAPAAGSLRLSAQFPGCRVVPVHRRIIGVVPLVPAQYATSPVQASPGV
jgi:hypothetical protein